LAVSLNQHLVFELLRQVIDVRDQFGKDLKDTGGMYDAMGEGSNEHYGLYQ